MATLTHHHEPVVAEHLQEHPGLQRTFVTIIVAGVVLLALGLLAAAMGWGAGHHEGAVHAATGHAEHAESPLWLKRLVYVAYAGWSVVVKRINEALSAWLVPGGILMLLVFGISLLNHDLFHWTMPGI
nr:hypothetical protein [Tanacetum cinerariifolium]